MSENEKTMAEIIALQTISISQLEEENTKLKEQLKNTKEQKKYWIAKAGEYKHKLMLDND